MGENEQNQNSNNGNKVIFKGPKLGVVILIVLIIFICIVTFGIYLFNKGTSSVESENIGKVDYSQTDIKNVTEEIRNESNPINNTSSNEYQNTNTQIDNEKEQYVGIYKNSYGESDKIAINEKGELYLSRKYDGKDVIDIIDLSKKDKDGSIIVYDKGVEEGVYKIVIYPKGVNIPLQDGKYFEYTDNEIDTNKIRIVFYNNIEGGIIYCKNEGNQKNDTVSNTNAQIDNEKEQYVGTYKNSYGESDKIAINEKGELYLSRKYDGKDVIDIIDLSKKDKDGSIIVYDKGVEEGVYKIVIYPKGVNIPLQDGKYFEYTDNEIDTNKIRIVFYNDIEGGIISSKVD